MTTRLAYLVDAELNALTIAKGAALNTLETIAGVAAGQPLLSGGVATAPAWAGWYLVGTAGQTYTLPTVGGAVPLGTGTQYQLTVWSGTNTVAGLGSVGATGSLLLGNTGANPSWLAISVPAAGICNYLGVNNGETAPSWKSASSNPGLAASILATDTNGILTLEKIKTGLGGGDGVIQFYSNLFGIIGATEVTWNGPSTLFSVTAATAKLIVKNNADVGIGLDPNAKTGGFNLYLSPDNLTANRRVTFGDADLTFTGGGTIALTAGQTYTLGSTGGTIPTAAGTLTVSTVNAISAAGVITHAITSSSNPGATASLLATDGSGYLKLAGLGLGTGTPTADTVAYLYKIFDGTTTQRGFHSAAVVSSSGASGGDVYALYFQAAQGNNANNHYELGGVSGILQHYGQGTISRGYIFYSQAAVYSSGGITTLANYWAAGVYSPSTGIVASHFGFRSGDLGNANTNYSYGVFVEDQSASAIESYTIYTGSAANGVRLGSKVAIAGSADAQQLVVTGYSTQAIAVPVMQVTRADVAAGIACMLGLTAKGSGADNDGGSITYKGQSSTTSELMGLDQWLYVDATDASYTTRRIWSAYDKAGAREGFRIEASGSAPMLSFYGGAAVVRGAALTAQLTTLTFTAPGTPDYAIQDFAQNGGAGIWGFVDHDEANTVLSVIANLQTRVAELEARLGSATGVNLFA